MTKTAIPTVRWIGSIDPSWNWNLLGAVFLVFLTVIAPAQTVVVDTLHATQPWGQRTAYTFPSIRVVGDEAISERINRTLMIDFLGEDLHVAKDPLSALWGEDTGNGMARIPLLEWSGVRTSAGVFTVQFTGEFCGAYCEDFDQHFLFDVRTGMRLDPVGLFKTEDEAAVNADPLELQSADVDALQVPRQQAAPGFAAQLARWSQWTAQRPITRALARA